MFINYYKNRTETTIPQAGPCAESSQPTIPVVRRGIGFMMTVTLRVTKDRLYRHVSWEEPHDEAFYSFVRFRRIPFLKLIWDGDYVYLSQRSLEWRAWADQKIDISWHELRGSFSFQDQSRIDLLKIEILKKQKGFP